MTRDNAHDSNPSTTENAEPDVANTDDTTKTGTLGVTLARVKGRSPNQRPCAALRLDGKPCGGFALTSGFCTSHDPDYDMQAARSRGGQNRRKPGAMEVLREMVEERLADVVRPLFEGLVAERVVGFEDGAPVTVEDHAIRLKAADSLLDRAFGRPVTRTELSGTEGGPLTISAILADDARDTI